MFQHTAARRQLHDIAQIIKYSRNVSTHSRAEAAADRQKMKAEMIISFNTQPRGGSCHLKAKIRKAKDWFQHTAARRQLLSLKAEARKLLLFQHTAARRQLHEDSAARWIDLRVSTHSRAEAAALATALN